MELDSITVTRGEGGDYETLPEDIYEVMIEDIKAEMRPNSYHDNKEELSLNMTFTLTEGEYEGRKLFRRVNPHISIAKPSKLYEIVKAVEGKELEGDFFDSFKLKTLLGRLLRVTVKNVVKGDKTYSNIDSFLVSKLNSKSPAKKGSAPKEDVSEDILDELAGAL